MRRVLDVLSTLADVTKTDEANEIYKKYRTEYKQRAEELKRQKITKQIEESDNKTKTIWTLINKEFRNNNVLRQPPSNIDANEFNDFFCNILNELADTIPGPRQQASNFLPPATESSFFSDTRDHR